MRHNLLDHVMYDLKRRYGVQGDYYRINTGEFSIETGKTDITRTVYRCKRMIELPTGVIRNIRIGGSSFPQGNQEVDVSSTIILIDAADLPIDFTYKPDDYIILRSKIRRQHQSLRRFNVERLDTLEDNSLLMATARFIEGLPIYAVHDSILNEPLSLSEQLDQV